MFIKISFLNWAIDLFREIQIFINILNEFPVGCGVINFSVSALTAFCSFPIVFVNIKGNKELIIEIANIRKLAFLDKFYYFGFILLYTFITGISSAALIALQTGKISIATAVGYGFGGPFLLRNNLLKQVKNVAYESVKKDVVSTIETMDSPYAEELEKIRNRLKSLNKNNDENYKPTSR